MLEKIFTSLIFSLIKYLERLAAFNKKVREEKQKIEDQKVRLEMAIEFYEKNDDEKEYEKTRTEVINAARDLVRGE